MYKIPDWFKSYEKRQRRLEALNCEISSAAACLKDPLLRAYNLSTNCLYCCSIRGYCDGLFLDSCVGVMRRQFPNLLDNKHLAQVWDELDKNEIKKQFNALAEEKLSGLEPYVVNDYRNETDFAELPRSPKFVAFINNNSNSNNSNTPATTSRQMNAIRVLVSHPTYDRYPEADLQTLAVNLRTFSLFCSIYGYLYIESSMWKLVEMANDNNNYIRNRQANPASVEFDLRKFSNENAFQAVKVSRKRLCNMFWYICSMKNLSGEGLPLYASSSRSHSHHVSDIDCGSADKAAIDNRLSKMHEKAQLNRDVQSVIFTYLNKQRVVECCVSNWVLKKLLLQQSPQ
jgi:hypothetical protein